MNFGVASLMCPQTRGGILDVMKTATLTRSTDNRVIAGVCAGLADYLGWKPNTVRLLFVASCLLPGPQFLIYLLLWMVIPNRRN